MRLLSVLIGAALVACVEPSSAPAVAPLAAPSSAPPPRRNLFIARTECAPDAMCPVDPAFPQVNDIYFEDGRPCIAGLDRAGCLANDGWRFAPIDGAAPSAPRPGAGRFDHAPAECPTPELGWVIPLDGGATLFWQKNGERRLVTEGGCRTLSPVPIEPSAENARDNGIVARDPSDVWVWTPRFVGHFDGARWERSMRPAPCVRDARDAIDASVVASDGSIWFVRCEQQSRGLVRFDPRSGLVTPTALTPALGLALVGGKVAATDFDDETKAFRQHVFEADGREASVAPSDRPFLRAGFEDGSAFVAPSGLFTEVVRVGGGSASTATIAIPTPAHGFYAPSSREVWIGGEKLYRWRDGMMAELPYRPDTRRAVVEIISGSGPNDVWVASRPAAGGGGPILLSHWDGVTWRQESLGPSVSRANALAVASPSDAWLTTDDALFHWNGASWSVAGHFAPGRGPSLALTPSAVFVLGNDTIYRRARP